MWPQTGDDSSSICVIVSGVVDVAHSFGDGAAHSQRHGIKYVCGALSALGVGGAWSAKRLRTISIAPGSAGVLPATLCYVFDRYALEAVTPTCAEGLRLAAARELLEAVGSQLEAGSPSGPDGCVAAGGTLPVLKSLLGQCVKNTSRLNQFLPILLSVCSNLAALFGTFIRESHRPIWGQDRGGPICPGLEAKASGDAAVASVRNFA